MDTRMLNLLYSREAMEKAKKRGRAYLCLGCQKQKGLQIVGERGPMEDHVLKFHVPRDRVPFYCRLCTFKCMTLHQMTHHVNHYTRHLSRAREMNVTNHQEWLESSPVPYQIGESDLLKYTQEESLLFFLKKQAGEPSPATTMMEPAAAASSPDQLAGNLTSDSLHLGYVAASPAIGESHPVMLTSPGSTISRMGPTPVTPVQSVIETENPLPVGQQLQQVARASQQVTGLGLWTGQTAPTGIQLTPSAGQNMETVTPMQAFTTPLQGPVYRASPIPGMNLSALFQPIRTNQGVPSAFTPGNPVAAAPQHALLSPQGGVSLTMLPIPEARPEGLSTATMPAGNSTLLKVAERTDDLGQALLSAASTTRPVMTQTVDDLSTAACPTGSPALPVVSLQTEGLDTILPTGFANLPGVVQRSGVNTVVSRPASDLGSVEAELTERTTSVAAAETERPQSIQEEQTEVKAKDGESTEAVEDLWPQLMPEGEADRISEAGDQDTGKRKSEDEAEVEVKRRKAETSASTVAAERGEGTELEAVEESEEQEAEGSKDWRNVKKQIESKMGPTLEISLVAMNGLVSAIQSGNRQSVRTEKASDRVEKALTEATCMLGKVVAALNGLKKAVEENTREDKRREDRWFNMERKREEEREKEREAERRREDRRRDAEKKEREEIRKLITGIGEKKDTAKGVDKKATDKGDKKSMEEKEKNSGKGEKRSKEERDEKENQKKEAKSVLSKLYTENSMRDLSNMKY